MSNPFTAHSRSVNETDAEHVGFALAYGWKWVIEGIAATLHAALPFLFVTTADKINDELPEMRKHSPGQKKLS